MSRLTVVVSLRWYFGLPMCFIQALWPTVEAIFTLSSTLRNKLPQRDAALGRPRFSVAEDFLGDLHRCFHDFDIPAFMGRGQGHRNNA